MSNRCCLFFLTLALSVSAVGCGTDIDTTYGRTRGKSINGTGVLAELFRERGHEVRSALKANDTLSDWADVIVRFAPQPGPIEQQEGVWLSAWLNAKPLRKLVYIPRDFDAEPEFWDALLAVQPKGADPQTVKTIEEKRSKAKTWVSDLPSRSKTPAQSADWFEFESKPAAASTSKTLEGPWASGVDPKAAAVSKHEVFKVVGGEDILLSGDGSPLVIGWSFANESRVLVIANASFLLNASLLNHARRPLTMRLVDWVGSIPTHIAFLEGRRVAVGESGETAEEAGSQFHLLTVPPFNWLAVHFIVFLSLFAFSLAFRLGRPLPEAASGVERPSAHPEALGALFARTRRADAARYLLEAYRRWRHQSPIAGRSAPNPPPPQ